MAQLSDDCFAFGGQLLSVDAAAALIADRIPPIEGLERVALAQAHGRVLAGGLVARTPLPPFFNSAVDGYAFAHASLGAGATRLPLAGRLAAGDAARPLPPGTAMRVLTGAPMPEGADTVMMQEDAVLEGDALLLPPGLKRGANCRPAGEDVPQGAEALPAGTLLTAPGIGLAAALGFAVLDCRRPVRVGVFSTGNELASPGQPLGPAQTYDSNRFTLMAMLARLPVVVTDLGILPDREDATRAALAAAARDHDVLITSGGVSAGEEDHVRAAIESFGSLVFWRLAVKPGRPAALGVVGGTPVLGLPGKSGGGRGVLPASGAAADPAAGGGHRAAAAALPGAGGLPPQEKGRPPRIPARADRTRPRRPAVRARGGGAADQPHAVSCLLRTAGGDDAAGTRHLGSGAALRRDFLTGCGQTARRKPRCPNSSRAMSRTA